MKPGLGLFMLLMLALAVASPAQEQGAPAGAQLLRPDPYLWKQEVRLTVEPGTTHYVVVAYKPERSWALPGAGAPLILKEIPEAEAAPLLQEMKMQLHLQR